MFPVVLGSPYVLHVTQDVTLVRACTIVGAGGQFAIFIDPTQMTSDASATGFRIASVTGNGVTDVYASVELNTRLTKGTSIKLLSSNDVTLVFG